MPSTPGDPHNAEEDIIELTDMIERGPGAPAEGGAGDGVDLSFERELEDLFAEPAGEGHAADGEMPGMDSLELPEEVQGPEGEDIDLDGLDALLAEAEKSIPAETELPELPDDYLSEATTASTVASGAAALADTFMERPAASAADAGAGPSEVLAAVNARLDDLESRLSSLPESLAATFEAMLATALADFKAGIPAAPEAPVDPAPMIEELSAKLHGELAAVRTEIAALPQVPDSQTLAGEIREQLAAEMPWAMNAPVDPVPMVEELSAKLYDELASVRSEIAALPQVPDSQALTAEIRQQLAAEMPQPVNPPVDQPSMDETLSPKVEEELAALRAEIAALPQAPDTSDLVSRQQMADAAEVLRQELLAEIRKAVPAAAAQIIREEIQALLQEEE